MAPTTPNQRAMTVQQQRFTELRTFLGSKGIKANLQMALPKHMNADRMVRVALTAISRTPKLMDCTPESLALALLTASQLGLEPNGRDAHLIPYGTQCQLIVDYKGLIQLAYRSGMVDGITARAVYSKDRFEFEFGSNERLLHVPCEDDDPGELRYAWAMVRFKDGSSKFVVLFKRDVERRRRASRAADKQDSPWVKYPEAMWAKSAVRELAKWMPQTPEYATFHKAVEADESAESGIITITQEIDAKGGSEPGAIDVPPSKSAQLAEFMRQNAPDTPKPPEPAPPAVEETLPANPPADSEPDEAALAFDARYKEYSDLLSEAPDLATLKRIWDSLGEDEVMNRNFDAGQAAASKLAKIYGARKRAIEGSRGTKQKGLIE